MRPEVCDATSPGLGTAPACLGDDAVRVTVLFEPGGGAPANAVVLARSCGDPATAGSLAARVAQWSAALGPRGTAVCLAEPLLDVFAADAGTLDECRLAFPFPAATGPGLSPPDTLTGPARIVVETVASPLPTDLVGRRCASAVATRSSIACIDELFRIDGTCFLEPENANEQIGRAHV